MRTQASAVTFLSVPGQAYTDGMRLHAVFISDYHLQQLCCAPITFVPHIHKLKVFTAYEYLKNVSIREQEHLLHYYF